MAQRSAPRCEANTLNNNRCKLNAQHSSTFCHIHSEKNIQGRLYVLENPSLPGILKIGMTSKRASERAKDLSNTSIPTPFSVVHETDPVADVKKAEQAVHELLDRQRVTPQREFFSCTKEEAIAAINKVIKAAPSTSGTVATFTVPAGTKQLVINFDDLATEVSKITLS